MRFDLLDGQVALDSIYLSYLDIALENRVSCHGDNLPRSQGLFIGHFIPRSSGLAVINGVLCSLRLLRMNGCQDC
jgi:hypothetical protein